MKCLPIPVFRFGVIVHWIWLMSLLSSFWWIRQIDSLWYLIDWNSFLFVFCISLIAAIISSWFDRIMSNLVSSSLLESVLNLFEVLEWSGTVNSVSFLAGLCGDTDKALIPSDMSSSSVSKSLSWSLAISLGVFVLLVAGWAFSGLGSSVLGTWLGCLFVCSFFLYDVVMYVEHFFHDYCPTHFKKNIKI